MRIRASIIADRCKTEINRYLTVAPELRPSIETFLPEELQPEYLLQMCDKVEYYINIWPEDKLHRWVGYILAGMIANGITTLPQATEIARDD